MGKVHGGLARAGKVKAQTPKIEKKEKHKAPRGRAYKRLLFRKRFIAIVHGQDRVAFGLQGIGQGNTQNFLVFDDKDAFAHAPSGMVKITFVPMFS